MIVDLTIHSFSLWHHFRHVPGFDAVAFADLAADHGLSGISLSLNDPQYRHLGGKDTALMDRLRAHLDRLGMSLEVDTSGTDPEHMREMIGAAERMGATALRTYTRHSGTPDEMAARTTDDLRAVMAAAAQAGIVVVLENHEDFTGPELAAIVGAVDHPNLRILYDYGNSQMVLEDPDAALSAVLPLVHSVHVKDHVMVHPDHAGRLTVAGVPMGEGFLPITDLTRRLLGQGLRRLTFENVWAYSAGIRPGRQPQPGVVLGSGAFRFLAPPFDPARIVLDQSAHCGPDLATLERTALNRGMAWFKSELTRLGCTGRWRTSA